MPTKSSPAQNQPPSFASVLPSENELTPPLSLGPARLCHTNVLYMNFTVKPENTRRIYHVQIYSLFTTPSHFIIGVGTQNKKCSSCESTNSFNKPLRQSSNSSNAAAKVINTSKPANGPKRQECTPSPGRPNISDSAQNRITFTKSQC